MVPDMENEELKPLIDKLVREFELEQCNDITCNCGGKWMLRWDTDYDTADEAVLAWIRRQIRN